MKMPSAMTFITAVSVQAEPQESRNADRQITMDFHDEILCSREEQWITSTLRNMKWLLETEWMKDSEKIYTAWYMH